MSKTIIRLLVLFLTLFFLGSCDLGVDLGGFFYSYSNPDSRFSEKDSLSMPSDPSVLETMPLNGTKLTFSFTVISDIHTNGSDVPHLKQFVNTLLLPEDNFILDCGDSTQSGYKNQFNSYKTIMDSSGLAWFAAIGNHDLYHEGWKYYKNIIGKTAYTVHVGNPTDPGSTLIIALDSANGTLGRKQMNWLEKTLKENRNQWGHTIVFTHSQFFSTGLSTVVQFSGTEEIYKLMYLFKTNSVDYVFMGHNHKWDSKTINGVKYIALDPLKKECSDNSYVRVTVDGKSISHERLMIK